MATAATSTARFSLTLDQLWLIQHRCDVVSLPPEFSSEWSDEVSSDERASRELDAELGLIDQGLMTAGDAGFAERISPAILGFLALFSDPALVLGIRSWGEGRSYVQTVAMMSGFAVSLVRTQRVDGRGSVPQNEDTVEVSAFELPQLISESLRSLTVIGGSDGGPRTSGQVTMSMVETQGLIEAIRTGDDAILESAARLLGRLDDVSSVVRASSAITAGFTVFANSRVTDDGISLHWFCSTDGWFKLAVTPPSSRPTTDLDAVEYAETAEVRITPATRASIVAGVTTAVASLVGVLRG